MMPSASICRRLPISTFWLSPYNDRFSSLKRQGSWMGLRTIKIFRLLPIMLTVVATLHVGKSSFCASQCNPRGKQ